MGGREGLFRNLRSIAGMALIGFGTFCAGWEPGDACGQLSRLVGISAEASQTFGGLIAVGFAASQVWRSYMFERRELLLGVCADIDIILAGAAGDRRGGIDRDGFAGDVEEYAK